MIFWGWGRQDVTRQVSDRDALVLAYKYIHVMWLLRWAWGLEYQAATLTPNGWMVTPMTREQARANGADQVVTLHWWWRWSLPGLLAAVVMAVLVSVVIGAILA